MKIKRLFLVILDSFGIGALPDAADYGDEGSNTYSAVRSCNKLNIPNLKKLGLDNIDIIALSNGKTTGAYGAMAEKSKGKDTTVGHWEISGVVSPSPLPTYPDGFPDELMQRFSEAVGRGWIKDANKPYSGTAVIKEFGQEHCRTGDYIVYTSADSVFQIAAHEEIVPLDELYQACIKARKILTGSHGVGRVIARPFLGQAPDYYRTGNRHDYSLEPPKKTMLDAISASGKSVISIGKIRDIFAGRGVTDYIGTKSNQEGMQALLDVQKKPFTGLCFANLVDFDMLYGHRNDVEGYALALNQFDAFLPDFISGMAEDDALFIMADHGCDPATPSTDHSREYVPFLAYGNKIKAINLGIRTSFADTAATVCEMLGAESVSEGTSFLKDILI